jgi:RNA polymerase sigma-70 factor (ECF subfamily)
MDRDQRPTLPMPEADTPWTGGTKDRLVAKSKVDTSPEIERLVAVAVTRAKQGDRDAVRFLYLRYADNVYGYVRTIVRDHHDAEDVTQQVFAKLMTAIVKFEPRGVPFVAWLLRMAHNVAVDAVRARRSTPAPEIYGADQPAKDGGEELSRSIQDALQTLPEDQRQVVVLRHVLGLTPVEIAEQLGRTHSSVYGLHHRGRRALCAELERLDAKPLTAERCRMAVAS